MFCLLQKYYWKFILDFKTPQVDLKVYFAYILNRVHKWDEIKIINGRGDYTHNNLRI